MFTLVLVDPTELFAGLFSAVTGTSLGALFGSGSDLSLVFSFSMIGLVAQKASLVLLRNFRFLLYLLPFSVSTRYERGPTLCKQVAFRHDCLATSGCNLTVSPICSSGKSLAVLS